MRYYDSYRIKRLGTGNIPMLNGYPGYPSYLPGVFEFQTNLPRNILGMTDGKMIVTRKNLRTLKDFVRFHEEEHVKDMFASELEIDKKALRRLLLKGSKKDIGKVRKLLRKRWGELADELFAF